MRNPEMLRGAVALGLAVSIGAGALTGCAGEPEASQPVGTMAANPKYETAVGGNDTVITTTTMEPNVALDQLSVTESPLGALKDDALSASWGISPYVVEDDEASVVAEARAKVNALGDIRVVPDGNLHIDLIVAQAATNESSLYTHEDSDYILSKNQETSDTQEAAIDLIQDPEVRAKAERTLDLVQAEKAMEARLGTSPSPKVSDQMLGYVEDPAIKQLAVDAIGLSVTKSEPAGEIATQLKGLNEAINTQSSQAYTALLNGSNTQARSINAQIEAFNAAHQGE